MEKQAKKSYIYGKRRENCDIVGILEPINHNFYHPLRALLLLYRFTESPERQTFFNYIDYLGMEHIM